MGFNIGVYSEQASCNRDCNRFIDRAFYNFVNEGEQYGDESILIRSGQYYGLDLSPLLKLVYMWDEVTPAYISENIQDTDFLLNLITTFRDKIQEDNTVCDKITYVWYEKTVNIEQAEIDKWIREMGEENVRPFLDMIDMQKKQIEADPNPWKSYFEERQIVRDLNNLADSIQCYRDNGVSQIYLTAG